MSNKEEYIWTGGCLKFLVILINSWHLVLKKAENKNQNKMKQRFSTNNNNKQQHQRHHKEFTTRPPRVDVDKSSKSHYYYLIVFVVAFVAYSNTLNAEFVYDDT